MSGNSQELDVFDSILDLEDQYHAEGYALGVADGAKSGRIDGRVFGLEKGFEKFLEMGKLRGKAAVWTARLPATSSKNDAVEVSDVRTDRVPILKSSDRLKKHVDRLSSLTDPDSYSTENSEEAVSETDGILKDAQSKATLIAKIVGENDVDTPTEGNPADVASSDTLRVRRNIEPLSSRVRSNEMEDFSGLPQARR